ncbi:GNAT family N-acetyltransferase [Rhizosphaericola mali]|uniref:N-acetyltransferase family protein n=1 Tax=Rhizosphaericola mali TaxID=2545455 RepID=A0A5P2G539_9BACT|nr:GNAT family N-acetyltransferase [Rhizosphaericola mali]QES90307.1 N-acetyltransferase family protein [Rhizosphaericola mali]
MEKLSYRDAQKSDLQRIVDIYNTIVAGRMVTADEVEVTVEDRLVWFEAHNPNTRPLLVIENEDQNVIAWVSFQSFYGRSAYNKTAEISIYIDPAFRGKGLGKRILNDMKLQAPQYGIETILAFIFQHNVPSMTLFQKQGFEIYGNLPEVAELDGIKRSLIILGCKV